MSGKAPELLAPVARSIALGEVGRWLHKFEVRKSQCGAVCCVVVVEVEKREVSEGVCVGGADEPIGLCR